MSKLERMGMKRKQGEELSESKRVETGTELAEWLQSSYLAH